MEVIWDKDSRGGYLKRELKWGSVIMGNTEGMVVHKRSEIPRSQRERFLSWSEYVT